jgi:60 kDa SS-A/Ro ribonucleoprotein
VKYQQRHGWSHSDLLRLAHPKAPSREHEAVFRWMLNGTESLGEREVKRKVRGEDRVAKYAAVGSLPRLIEAFAQAKGASSKNEIVKLIAEFDLPREAIPTQWLNGPRCGKPCSNACR